MSLPLDAQRGIAERARADELLRMPSERPLSEILGDDASTYAELERAGRVTCGPVAWEALNRSLDDKPVEERFPEHAKQVWVIGGAHIMRALREVSQGRDPDEVYLETYANSEHRDLDD